MTLFDRLFEPLVVLALFAIFWIGTLFRVTQERASAASTKPRAAR